MTTLIYTERLYPDTTEEERIYPPGTMVIVREHTALSQLSDEDCAVAEGLLMFRHWVTAADLDRMPRLRAIVRMGVGYDRVDRAAAAARGVLVCNVPDYGTTEVADHAIALALALRRGLMLYVDRQRRTNALPWDTVWTPLVQRSSTQVFGIVGLGRIGIAAALRAKALGFRVVAFDPNVPNGTELAVGVERAATLESLLRQTDVLSLHAPSTPDTRGMIGAAELAQLPPGAVVVNTARGPLVDLDALGDALRSGHLAGAGLDVIPVEPPPNPLPWLLEAYRAREEWLDGRLIVTPHAAYFSPHALNDIRIKSAETMRAALWGNRAQNVIAPES